MQLRMRPIKQSGKRILRTLMALPGASALVRELAQIGLLSSKVWSRLPVDALFEIVLPNGAVVLYKVVPGDGIGRTLYYGGLERWPEAATSSVFIKHLAGVRTFVDVGANTGIYSLLAAAANPGVRVFAYEPVASTLRHFERLVELNGWRDRIQIHNAAVADHSGSTSFHVPDVEFPLMGSLDPGGKRGILGTVVEIPVIDLDSSLEAERIDMVKIDVEGFEDRVLIGMRNILRRDRPNLFVECAPEGPLDRIEEILFSLNYRAYHITPQGPVPSHSLKSSTTSTLYNFLFLPAEGPQV